jgi:hypothetical protein
MMCWMSIWAHPYTVTSVQVLGAKFWKIREEGEPKYHHVVKFGAVNRLICISHPYWMYEVFEHPHMLLMGIWVHTLTLLHL